MFLFKCARWSNMTHGEISAELGIDRTTISHALRKDRPRPITKALAEALGFRLVVTRQWEPIRQ
jgi:hypothetical protein